MMDATSFHLNVSLPADLRYAKTMADLAVHAARYAGCRASDADAYGAEVEVVVRLCLERAARSGSLAVIVRRDDGALEFLVACDERFDAAPARDRHVTIGWTREAGRQMCRVARTMPREQ
jgi:hypothetical protein